MKKRGPLICTSKKLNETLLLPNYNLMPCNFHIRVIMQSMFTIKTLIKDTLTENTEATICPVRTEKKSHYWVTTTEPKSVK